jgi:GGDEF domain-containing protein
MKNFAKQMNFYATLVLLVIFACFFYFLYDFRFETEYFIYFGAVFFVAAGALRGGSITGLVFSIFAIFVYSATFFYSTINSARIFDITYKQGSWLVIYVLTALIVGKIGDALKFYCSLHKRYPQEMQDLMHDFVFRVVPMKSFNNYIEEEMARSRRMQTHFTLAVISIEEISEITRVFGEKGIYDAVKKLKLYLRAIVKENDKITKLNNTTFEILFAQFGIDEVMPRLAHLTTQLENTYLEYKKTTIKFPIKIHTGTAVFPDDGDDLYHIKNKAEGNLTSLACQVIPEEPVTENL